MNTVQPVVIDEVKTGLDLIAQHPDVLEIEWFETQKQKLTRLPGPVGFRAEIAAQKEWQQGDALYSNGQLTAAITIKTCLTICFPVKNDREAADFCYFIGNQHLPVFLVSGQQFAVPYDGRLYEQLSTRYGGRIELKDSQLLSTQSLRHLAKIKHMNIKNSLITCLFAVILLLQSCQKTKDSVYTASSDQQVTATDSRGKAITLPHEAMRIVVLYNALVDDVYMLQAGKKL